MDNSTRVYYWFLGRRYGSITLEELIGLVDKGLIFPDTKIEINGIIVEADRVECLKPRFFSVNEVEEPTVIEKEIDYDNAVSFDVTQKGAVMYLDENGGARVVIEPEVIK